MWEKPYQWSSQRSAVLLSLTEWENGLAKWDFQWSVSNPSSLSNYFFASGFRPLFCQTDKQFLVQFEIPFAACCSCGTTPPANISGLTKHKLCLGLYNNHSAFISIMETQFPIKFQSGLLAQRDSRASDQRGKSCYLDKALFVYIMQLDICVCNCTQTGRSDFYFIYNQIHFHCAYISGSCC